MIDTFTPDPAAAWFALRMHQMREQLAHRWRAAFPAGGGEAEQLIAVIADYLCRPPDSKLANNAMAMHKAAELGILRFTQGASVPQLLREYQTLADLIEEFLLEQVRGAATSFSTTEVLRAIRCVTQSVGALEQQSVDAFVQKYTDTIERQSAQLIAFGRLVGHEMRQPLGVLQLMSGVVPIRAGDHELIHLLDIFDRNIRRLTDVAGRLERLSHEGLDRVVSIPDSPVDLAVIVSDVVGKLRDMASAHDVRIQVDSELPSLRVDAAGAEMIFMSLIANAIKYSDQQKPARLVEVLWRRDELLPTVVVRDNGVGMPPRRVQHMFREFSRAHAHREPDGTGEGLGLGLTIVRTSMDAVGGTVLLQSREGVGTTVTLSWPRRTTPAVR